MGDHSSILSSDKHAVLRGMGNTILLKLQQIPRSWQVSIAVFIAGRILFTLWGAFIWWMRLMPTGKSHFLYDIQPILEGIPGMLLGMWQRWDGIHYQRIAMFGYEDKLLTAFYPLYPLLGRVFALIFGNNAILGLIFVSNAATLVAIWLFYRIVSEDFSNQVASETLFYLLIFPTTFFLYAIYPQSLLLMFMLLSYWLARRGHWVWSGLAGFCAGLTHSTAVVLTVLVGWEAARLWLQKKEKTSIAMLIAPFANFVGIGAFMAWRFLASFPPYQQLLAEGWGRNATMPWDGLIAVVKFVPTLSFDLDHLMAWIYLSVFLLIVGLTIWSFRKIPYPFWLFQAALLIMILSANINEDPLMGILRYPLVMFPLFVELAIVGKTKAWRLVKFSVFVLLSLVCSAWFFMWKFVG